MVEALPSEARDRMLNDGSAEGLNTEWETIIEADFSVGPFEDGYEYAYALSDLRRSGVRAVVAELLTERGT